MTENGGGIFKVVLSNASKVYLTNFEILVYRKDAFPENYLHAEEKEQPTGTKHICRGLNQLS